MHWRLFWAVMVPPGLKRHLVRLQDELKQLPLHAKWVEPENLHLTVLFLGDTEQEKVPPMVQAVRTAVLSFSPFTLKVGGTGYFPPRGTPRVLWVGLQDEGEMLATLRRLVIEATSGTGLALKEENVFHPHLTLARLRSGQGVEALRRWQQERRAAWEEIGFWLVDSICLMQSLLRPTGPVYKPVAEIKFAG